jgi:hypothetical protein
MGVEYALMRVDGIDSERSVASGNVLPQPRSWTDTSGGNACHIDSKKTVKTVTWDLSLGATPGSQ